MDAVPSTVLLHLLPSSESRRVPRGYKGYRCLVLLLLEGSKMFGVFVFVVGFSNKKITVKHTHKGCSPWEDARGELGKGGKPMGCSAVTFIALSSKPEQAPGANQHGPYAPGLGWTLCFPTRVKQWEAESLQVNAME